MSYLADRVPSTMRRDQRATPQDSAPERKRRGAFFTPPEVADFLTNWAIRSSSDVVLEPSCGEAAFLRPAARRLKSLGANPGQVSHQIFGIDIHEPSLELAAKVLAADGIRPTLVADSFFSIDPPGGLLPSPIPFVDAVVGNPPFIRYQHFSGTERARAKAAALRQGVNLTGLANSWAAILIHASAFLNPDGRLAMVLPAELLTVNYSEAIRRFLLERFASVHLIHFRRLLFKGALEDIVLVLAEGAGGCSGLSFHLLENERALAETNPLVGASKVLDVQSTKWTELLLPSNVRRLIRDVASEWFVALRDYGSPELGTVTGANRLFALRQSQVEALDVKEPDITRISPPGTRHFEGLRFTKADWLRLARADEPVWLLTLKRPIAPDHPAWELVSQGERDGIHLRYKCRIRDPWYLVPPLHKPDLFFTYMSHRFPRLIRNVARVGFVNSMHGIDLRGERRTTRATLPIAALNSLTQLSAELIGRSYGGGILKLEPKEAGQLLVPRPDLLQKLYEMGSSPAEKIERQIRSGDWEAAQECIDSVLLRDLIALSSRDAESIGTSISQLRNKRLDRGKKERPGPTHHH